jgi:hypothetical protein
MALGLASWSGGIKDGKVRIAAGTIFDINAVISAEGDPQQDEIEIKGDDELKATFVSNIREEITIVANSVTFDVIQSITGNSYSSSAAGQEIALGTTSQANPPFIEVYGDSQAKNLDGTAMTLRKIWHKVQITSIKVSQQSETEFSMELKGTAYTTATDIVGGALTTNRVATLKVFT